MNISPTKSSARGVATIVTPLVAFVLIVAGSNLFNRGPAGIPADTFMQDEPQGISPATQRMILEAQDAVRKTPNDSKAIFRLSGLYLQAIRENADTAFYERIEALLKHLEDVDRTNADIDFLRGTIAAGRHDFPTALRIGTQLTTEHPEVSRYYGLLTDAQVELGMYDDAITTLQRMSDLRPDYNALTRIAYVREITGDTKGAIEMMENALVDSTGNAENTAWGLAELARLSFGNYRAQAELYNNEALKAYPNFAPALAGLAKIEMARGNTAAAKDYAKKAVDALALPEYAALLGDIEAVSGNADKAGAYYRLVEIGYERIAQSGTNVELERARFLTERNRNLKANVERARAVYADRPTIYAADTLAWTLYKNELYAEAQTYADKALSTGSQDAAILFHAGMIRKQLGRLTEAKQLFKQAMESNADFSLLEAPMLKAALQELN